jgi:hypothetical protein
VVDKKHWHHKQSYRHRAQENVGPYFRFQKSELIDFNTPGDKTKNQHHFPDNRAD